MAGAGDTAYKPDAAGGNSTFSLPDCSSNAMKAAFAAINTEKPGSYLCRYMFTLVVCVGVRVRVWVCVGVL